MSVIKEISRQGLDDVVAGPICDPLSVARIIEAGTAASVTLPLGGKIDMPQIQLDGVPLTVTGKVTRITEGEFVVTGPMATGTRVRMCRTAVLDTGSLQIVSPRAWSPSTWACSPTAASTRGASATC
jgi:microcystin degradation protein MlrC